MKYVQILANTDKYVRNTYKYSQILRKYLQIRANTYKYVGNMYK